MPRADFEVRLIEPYREGSASSQYIPATLDGSRPGVFYVNAAELKNRPIPASASLFLHEAIPGHHFQIALTNENAALPLLRKIPQYNAYIEGWALYVEKTRRAAGALPDAVPARAAGLGGELFRAMPPGRRHRAPPRGLVTRTGDQVRIETMGIPPVFIEREVDRYLAPRRRPWATSWAS